MSLAKNTQDRYCKKRKSSKSNEIQDLEKEEANERSKDVYC